MDRQRRNFSDDQKLHTKSKPALFKTNSKSAQFRFLRHSKMSSLPAPLEKVGQTAAPTNEAQEMLIATTKRFFSKELHSPEAYWVLFENGTLVHAPPHTVEKKSSAEAQAFAVQILKECERIAGTELGDVNVFGPDTRWNDISVYFMMLPSFPHILCLSVDPTTPNHSNSNDEENCSKKLKLIPTLLANLERDRSSQHIIASSSS